MTLENLYTKLQNEKPQLVYLSGKTCVGKSTFAARLRDSLGYEIIELDKIVVENVIKPQGLADKGTVFVGVYRNRDQRQLINPFVVATKKLLSTKKAQHTPIVVDGAIANVQTLLEVFGEYPELTFVYLHPTNLETYQRNIISRFMLARPGFSASLPKQFWAQVDAAEFELFCQNRTMTPGLAQSVERYARSSQIESQKRLADFGTKFKGILVVEV